MTTPSRFEVEQELVRARVATILAEDAGETEKAEEARRLCDCLTDLWASLEPS